MASPELSIPERPVNYDPRYLTPFGTKTIVVEGQQVEIHAIPANFNKLLEAHFIPKSAERISGDLATLIVQQKIENFGLDAVLDKFREDNPDLYAQWQERTKKYSLIDAARKAANSPSRRGGSVNGDLLRIAADNPQTPEEVAERKYGRSREYEAVAAAALELHPSFDLGLLYNT